MSLLYEHLQRLVWFLFLLSLMHFSGWISISKLRDCNSSSSLRNKKTNFGSKHQQEEFGLMILLSWIIVHSVRLFSFSFFTIHGVMKFIVVQMSFLDQCRIANPYAKKVIQILNSTTIAATFHISYIILYSMALYLGVYCVNSEIRNQLERFLMWSILIVVLALIVECGIFSIFKRQLIGSEAKPDES